MTLQEEGREARRAGKPLSANPYIRLDPAMYRHWDRGWLIEDYAFRVAPSDYTEFRAT